MRLRPEHLADELSRCLGERVEVGFVSVDGLEVLDESGRAGVSATDPTLAMAVPVLVGGDPVAYLCPEEDTLERGGLVARIPPDLVLQIANATMIVQRRADIAGWYRSLAQRVAEADEARTRLERDLHDGAQQLVLALMIELQLAVTEAADPLADPSVPAEVTVSLREVLGEVSAALEELRAIAHGLHPAALAQGGIQIATDLLGAQVGVRIALSGGEDLTPAAALAAYRLIEAAAEEAAQRSCDVAAVLEHDGGLLRVRVELGDGGRFDPGPARDRLLAVHGEIVAEHPLEAVVPLITHLAPPAEVPTTPTVLDGRYRQHIGPDDLRRAGFTETSLPNGHPVTSDAAEPIDLLVENSGIFEYVLDRGRFRWRQDQPGAVIATESGGSFVVTGREVVFVEDLLANDGRRMVLRFLWSTDEDGNLTLQAADEWAISRIMAATSWRRCR